MSDAAARKEQVRATFEAIAPEYDGAGCFAHFGGRLVEILGVQPGRRVLDVATGRGAVLLPAAERVGPTGEVIGIDLAESMARAAQAAAAQRGLPATAQVMDAERLEFPDGAFDCLLCGFGVMFFPDLDRALGEFRRVLKPGGRLGVSTWQVTQAADLGTVLDQLGFGVEDAALRFKDPADLERALNAAGFVDVRIQPDSATFRYADLDQYWQNARGTGLRRRLDTLDAAQVERVRAALTERLRSHRQADGIALAATALLAVARR